MLDMDNDVSKVTLCEQVADRIEKAIITQGTEAGRLPSENEMAQRFGVSRTIVRESLKLLKARGLVSSRVGGGAYITKPKAADVSEMLGRIIKMDKISDDDVYKMRIILEIAAGRDAAVRITADEIAIMENQVDNMERYMDELPLRIENDIAFHISLGKFSGNKLLGMIVESMTGVLRQFIERGIATSGGNEDGIYRHRRILDALRIHDPEIVEQEIRDQLEHSRMNVLKQQGSLGIQ
ncbi:HTH-type transcriptional repressor NanR [bioreactor metagenome]|uniref:HTH-type transcriptional repressor NanR n=1 Tax=bioreactor metagenome TaxID=1076179 RepID=A0A645CIS4_9ZZZZ